MNAPLRFHAQPFSDWYTDVEHAPTEKEHDQATLDQVVPGVSAGALLQAMEDPSVFPEIARGDLYVQLTNLRRIAANFTPTQKMDYAKFLAKMGKVETPEVDVTPFATAPGINIFFSGGSVHLGTSTAERDITPA